MCLFTRIFLDFLVNKAVSIFVIVKKFSPSNPVSRLRKSPSTEIPDAGGKMLI